MYHYTGFTMYSSIILEPTVDTRWETTSGKDPFIQNNGIIGGQS